MRSDLHENAIPQILRLIRDRHSNGNVSRLIAVINSTRYTILANVRSANFAAYFTLCSPYEWLPSLTSVLFPSQEEEDAVDETDQEDWRTNADTQVRLT